MVLYTNFARDGPFIFQEKGVQSYSTRQSCFGKKYNIFNKYLILGPNLFFRTLPNLRLGQKSQSITYLPTKFTFHEYK